MAESRRRRSEENVEERIAKRRGREVAPPLTPYVVKLKEYIFTCIDKIKNILRKKTFLNVDDWEEIEKCFNGFRHALSNLLTLITRSTRVSLTARFVDRLNVEIDKLRDLMFEIDRCINEHNSVELFEKIRILDYHVQSLIMRIESALVTLEEWGGETEKIIETSLYGVTIVPTIEIPIDKYGPIERQIITKLLSYSYIPLSDILKIFGVDGLEAINNLKRRGIIEVVYDPVLGEDIVKLCKGVRI